MLPFLVHKIFTFYIKWCAKLWLSSSRAKGLKTKINPNYFLKNSVLSPSTDNRIVLTKDQSDNTLQRNTRYLFWATHITQNCSSWAERTIFYCSTWRYVKLPLRFEGLGIGPATGVKRRSKDSVQTLPSLKQELQTHIQMAPDCTTFSPARHTSTSLWRHWSLH